MFCPGGVFCETTSIVRHWQPGVRDATVSGAPHKTTHSEGPSCDCRSSSSVSSTILGWEWLAVLKPGEKMAQSVCIKFHQARNPTSDPKPHFDVCRWFRGCRTLLVYRLSGIAANLRLIPRARARTLKKPHEHDTQRDQQNNSNPRP